MNITVKSTVDDRFALKVDAMISVMEKLCTVLEKENDLLEKNKVRSIERLVDPKVKLINIYTDQYTSLSSDKERFSALDKPRKNEVKAIAVRLQALMERNEILLNVNVNSTRRLIDMIATDVRKHENQQSGVYSASGHMGFGNKKGSNLTYNQVL